MSKFILAPFLLCFTFLTSFSQLNSVTLYEGCDFTGKKSNLGVGNFRVSQMKIGNDKLSSLKIPEGMKVTLYEHDKFDGRSVTYTSNMTCLPADWIRITSSLVVESEPVSNDYVIFYNDCYSKGFSRTLRPGTYTSNQLGLLSRNISSFTIYGNLRVKAYINNDNLSGYSVLHETNVSCLSKSQNDKIASLLIEYKPYQPPNPTYPNGNNSYATVYTNCNFSGNSLRLAPGYYAGDKLGLLKYDISSIEIPNNLKAKVYINNENMYGTSYTISETITCLSATLNNRIGSIVIEEKNSGYQYNNPPVFEKVFLYSDANYKGQFISLLPGTYATMSQVGFQNDGLSSLTVPQGYRVVLYEDEYFGGRTYTVTANKSGLTLSGWNDKASSIAIYKDY